MNVESNTMREFTGYRVLLADDEEISREVVANIVGDLGAECETVADGAELLAKLGESSEKKFDLVLIDINMPGMDGIEACFKFRESDHPQAQSLPFIGISADTDPRLFDRAISAGMNSMTLKPVSRATLYSHFTLTLKDNRANTVFRERVQQVIAASKTKNYFFSTVSHDIRTPLNAIIGFSQMLKLGFKTEQEQKEAIDSILVSGKTLLRLINDILDLSKLEAGRMVIDPEPTSCTKLLNEIVESFRIANNQLPIDIRCRVGEMPPLLMVDPLRLRQIAFNLLGNAVKFTEKGHVELRAAFEMAPGAKVGTLKMDVEDTGCGISEEDQQRIASPYVQLGSKVSRNGGTGLGLAICRQLVTTMGGEIELESLLGVGTTFYVTIPNVKIASEAMRVKPSTTQRINVTMPILDKSRRQRVLVVDDSRVNLSVLKAMLSRLGSIDIVTATNGKEAFDILKRPNGPKFDLVLTDMWMPEMDGEALVQAIRADSKLSSLPVCVVTADVEMQDTYAGKGFSDILLKPMTFDKLQKICGKV